MMFYLLLILNALGLLILLRISYSKRFDRFAGSALNPVLIVALICGTFNVDFLVLRARTEISIFELAPSILRWHVDLAYGVYTLLFFAIVSGILFAFATSPYRTHSRRSSNPSQDRQADVSARIIFAVAFAAGLYAIHAVFVELLPAMLAGQGTRQLYFLNYRFHNIVLIMLLPAFSLYASRQYTTNTRFWTITAAVVGIVLLTGSRGSLLLVGIILACGLVLRGRRFSPSWYLIAIPIIGVLLTYLRYLFRESWRFPTYSAFLEHHGGYTGVFFNTVEMSMAEVLTTLVHNLEQFRRPFYEGILGVLLYPVPRAWLPLKPYGASGVVTATVAPYKWELLRSEILATGFGDLLMHYGLLGGAAVAFVVGFVWLKSLLLVLGSNYQRAAFVVPFLIWWMYVFLRGSFFNLGPWVWTFAIVSSTHIVLTRIRIRNSANAGSTDFPTTAIVGHTWHYRRTR